MTQSPKIQKAKPKRKEKLSDKEQSERFKETALKLGQMPSSDAFEAIIETIVKKKT